MKIREIIEEVKLRKIIDYEKYGKKQYVTKLELVNNNNNNNK